MIQPLPQILAYKSVRLGDGRGTQLSMDQQLNHGMAVREPEGSVQMARLYPTALHQGSGLTSWPTLYGALMGQEAYRGVTGVQRWLESCAGVGSGYCHMCQDHCTLGRSPKDAGSLAL